MRVSFLIPAFNEERTIGEVLERIAALGLDAQVVVFVFKIAEGGE